MFLLALVPAAFAATWPEEADWAPLTELGAPLADPCDDFAGNDDWDIVGDATAAAAFTRYDGTDYFFRLRVGGDPSSGPSTWSNFEWTIAFETDFDAANPKYDYSIVLDGGSDTVTVYENTVGSDNFVEDDPEVALIVYDGTPSVAAPGTASGPTHAGEVDAVTSLCGDDDYFIDVWVAGTEFETLTGITDLTRVTPVVFNSTNGTWKDTGGCDSDTEDCDSWTAVIADADTDSDGDGLSNGTETGLGTDPFDADSDNGGVDDGDEVANGTNPLDGSDDVPVTGPTDTGTDTATDTGGTNDTGGEPIAVAPPQLGFFRGGLGCAVNGAGSPPAALLAALAGLLLARRRRLARGGSPG
ncbi:MAG: hypothetical protein H0V89_08235 [Deltaproteobacteria bacterium]|nr:hypothetical protein [Deltaproteobacteria bacterium]